MKQTIQFIFVLILAACGQNDSTPSESKNTQTLVTAEIQTPSLAGLWRGVLASPGGELPFGIQIQKTGDGYVAKILNGPERVDTSAVVVSENAVEIQFSWYDARLKAQLADSGDVMSGEWSKTAAGKISKLPFRATRGYPIRFSPAVKPEPGVSVTGVWAVEFTDEDGVSPAVGEFTQSGHKVNGTFLTPTGDYRFLAGDVAHGQLRLSAFDGAHAFLFNAKLDNGNLIDGNFWSRDTYHATWQAHRDEQAHAVLPDSWEMVKVTTDDQRIAFTFPDTTGAMVSLADERFQNKPVLINVFGTWCPNCNDEAPILAAFHEKYGAEGLEVIGLAFEFTGDAKRDTQQLIEFKKHHGIQYPLLLAGTNDKKLAAQTLGFLDQVVAYPTSLFLNRDHEVVAVHSGFAGPGTGEHFNRLVQELEHQIQAIVAH